MGRRFLALGLAALLGIGCACSGNGAGLAGWHEVESSAEIFEPDRLWEHINGAADAYLAYGFESLSYRELSDGVRSVAVEVYSHATPLDAFGIYRLENDAPAAPLAAGAEACLLAPYEARMLSGRDYVKLSAIEGEIDMESADHLLPHLARGGSDLPMEFAWLPTADRRPGSEQFTSSAFLGLRDLESCVSAEYGEVTIFLMLPGSGQTPRQSWESLAAGKWQTREVEGHHLLLREIPYRGTVALVRGEAGLMGITGELDEQSLVDLLLKSSLSPQR